MNENLPIKQKNNLFTKIKKFLKKIFYKEQVNYKEPINRENSNFIEENNSKKEKFQGSIKIEVKNDYVNELKREEFLDKLDGNLQVLYDFPIEKLEKLENYYKESIDKMEMKLANLKKAN